MTGLKALIEAFDDAIRQALEDGGVPGSGDYGVEGLKEDQAAFSGLQSDEQIAEAEATVLGYPVANPADMLLKTDFILREMRKLTEQDEEFCAYADQLRADLATILKSGEGFSSD